MAASPIQRGRLVPANRCRKVFHGGFAGGASVQSQSARKRQEQPPRQPHGIGLQAFGQFLFMRHSVSPREP